MQSLNQLKTGIQSECSVNQSIGSGNRYWNMQMRTVFFSTLRSPQSHPRATPSSINIKLNAANGAIRNSNLAPFFFQVTCRVTWRELFIFGTANVHISLFQLEAINHLKFIFFFHIFWIDSYLPFLSFNWFSNFVGVIQWTVVSKLTSVYYSITAPGQTSSIKTKTVEATEKLHREWNKCQKKEKSRRSRRLLFPFFWKDTKTQKKTNIYHFIHFFPLPSHHHHRLIKKKELLHYHFTVEGSPCTQFIQFTKAH